MNEPRDATKFTIAANAAMAGSLDFQDTQSFDDAKRGFVATWSPLVVQSADGTRDVWSLAPYLPPAGDQVEGAPAPPTVNPSLWRQAQLNTLNGLFEVVPDGIYQVRAFDMSNMTIIEGKTGLIIIDPLISVECARSAMALYRANRPQTAALEVTHVIYTHSHVDHFGGVEGILPDDPSAVEIYAPDGFLEHAVSENVYAGCAMGRRAQYMYGPFLKPCDHGQVDTGLGKGQSTGQVSLLPPTTSISKTGQTEIMAGITVIFHMTPGSEAPAEMDFYFPDFKAFCAAENATHNMHNIQTLRGANVRDALKWSKYLGEALELFGHEAEVMFASHHWPIWGNDRVASFLSRQRDMYRYLNDQTLRMLNKGYTGVEIAEVFTMPRTLASDWSCRGYYGSVSHNVKAVYDKYLGWFDGDPSNLHRLTPEDAAPRYVALMGGAAAVIEAARQAGRQGEYRWAAELLRHVVYADPDNAEAKDLQADALEQMGYQAECATWRNFFLMGAQELRGGIAVIPSQPTSPTMISAMDVYMIFDTLGAKLIGPLADALDVEMYWDFLGTEETNYVVRVQNGALSYVAVRQPPAAPDVTLQLARSTLDALVAGALSGREAISRGDLKLSGDIRSFLRFLCMLDDDDPSFPIVTPRSGAREAWLGRRQAIDAGVSELMDHPRVARARRFVGDLPRGC